jgi:hypothetical protein
VVSGAAMVLAFDARHGTRDVDAVFAPAGVVRQLARAVQSEMDLRDDWINHPARAFASSRHEVVSAYRLGDEDRDSPGGLGLIVRVGRKCRDGELPQPCPLGLVIDFADAHGLDRGVVADLDRGPGP